MARRTLICEGKGNMKRARTEESVEHQTNVSAAFEASTPVISYFDSHFGYNLTEEAAEKKECTTYKWPLDYSDKQSNSAESSILQDNINPNLQQHWSDVLNISAASEFSSSLRGQFLSLCCRYKDVLHHNKRPFYIKGKNEDLETMDAYIMHSINHIYKTKDIITKNSSVLAKLDENAAAELKLVDERFLDHGFTRPKVLILLPLASIVFRVVMRLIQLMPSDQKVTVQNLERFEREYGTLMPEEYEEMPRVLKKCKGSYTKPSKPSDFLALFGGNNEDAFMIGLKFTRKHVVLYSDFYQSDLIIASPLRLITKINEAKFDKGKDVDYLSSVEVLIIDHADIISMQNWSLVEIGLEHFNRMPKNEHGTDIMRVKRWYLDGLSKYYRQTVILGFYLTPEIHAVFNHQCFNYEGKLKLDCMFEGVLRKLSLPVKQIYERFKADSVADADVIKARHNFFDRKIFPRIKECDQGGIMIFMSSYYEFVCIRNFLRRNNVSFCELTEYSDQRDISRARLQFFNGERKIMLYTERAHFYRRYKIRGVRKLIMLSLPERKEFYPEIINMLHGSDDLTCNIVFNRCDYYKLMRILGTDYAKRMVKRTAQDMFAVC